MASQSPRLINFASGLALGCLFGLTVSVLPLLAIEHRKLITFLMHEPYTMMANQVLIVVSSSLSFACTFAAEDKRIITASRESLRANNFQLMATFFVFLYVACAYLCFKLHVARLPASLVSEQIWPSVGLAITLVSALIALLASISRALRPGQSSFVQHPIFLAGLLYLLASALSFTTWFPLLAIPGALVAITWYIQRATVRDARSRWRVIPYIY
jgi:hypothetical protein